MEIPPFVDQEREFFCKANVNKKRKMISPKKNNKDKEGKEEEKKRREFMKREEDDNAEKQYRENTWSQRRGRHCHDTKNIHNGERQDLMFAAHSSHTR